ncbi:hypothetical protein BS47DRAFT_1367899 [Hydnum rufescens UP504]|uniref:Uncharacterized protein n=1 Tax=Hydnum rufescens UP504 TaxID=1448309 RepID=A0A9P6AH82_9AGAM|nr:hypothetical protein BS47DRAFT_1367899 [Hydnum rufescens UP504]
MDLRSALIDKPRAIFGCILLSVAPSILVAMSATCLHIGVYAITIPEPKRLCKPFMIICCIRDGATRVRRHEPLLVMQPQLSQGHGLLWLRVFSDVVPIVISAIARLPFVHLPFAFSLFILVQGLSSRGGIEVLAQWWAVWIHKRGPLFAGTNIGATIVLCLVLQLWDVAQKPTFRTRDGAIQALALGANDGVFSAPVSAGSDMTERVEDRRWTTEKRVHTCRGNDTRPRKMRGRKSLN